MQQMNQGGMDMEMANASMSAGKKESKGMMMGMVACAVLAVAGIGFGVYEMLQANSAKQQISDLKVEIKKEDGTTTTLETDKIEVKENDKTIVIADSASSIVSSADFGKYIYVGDWGIKIKLPEELTLVTYSYDYYVDGPVEEAGDSASVCISGSEDHALYAFSSVGKARPGLVCIERNSQQREHLVDAIEIFHNDYGWYYLSGAQAYYTEPDTMARGYEENMIDLFNKHFSDPSNYSAI